MAGQDIIVVGASAGGLQALQNLLRSIPAGFPAAFVVVLHTSPTSSGILPQILTRACPLPARHALDGEPIVRGRVYVGPPDHHLLISGNSLRLTQGPRENGFRPAVDPLFRTAAQSHGRRVIGLILSGGLDDGTQGLFEIKQQGGIAIVQDPEEAAFPSMPASAVQNVQVDHVVKVAEMAAILTSYVGPSPRKGDRAMAKAKRAAHDIAERGTAAMRDNLRPGPPSRFTCPECGGALWEIKEGKLVRYRCHVGHGYTADGLVAAQEGSVEAALWTALRALEEKAELRRQMADRAARKKITAAADQYRKLALEAEARAGVIREVLMTQSSFSGNGKSAREKTRSKSRRSNSPARTA
jgi:two-component system chemotaxis response regulator CheB